MGKPTKKRRKAKAKPISARTAMRRVWKGTLARTKGCLTKADLCVNKRGKVVSKKQRAIGSKRLGKFASKWMAALARARKELKLKGFVACKKGTAYYALAKKYNK